MSAMLSVHPVGLNDEAQKILSVTMNVLVAGGCGVRLAEQLSGETVLIVDIDSDEGRAFYEQDNARHRAVVISGDERSYRADAMLRKPLRVQALRNLLSDLFESSESAAVVARTEESKSQPVGGGLPDSTLFNVMVNAVTTNSMYTIAAADGDAPVFLHGPSRHLYTRLTVEQLSRLAGLRGDAIKVSAIDELKFMKESHALESYRFERFLWLAEAKGADAAATTAVTGAFHLKEWPRFDINMVKPEYLSLSAIMTRKALGCSELARISGVPLETAYKFYYAAQACGAVEEKLAHAVVAQSVEETPAKKGTLISRIARKLGLSLV